MSESSKSNRIKQLIGVGILTLICAYISYNEMQYSSLGKLAEAQVKEVNEKVSGTGRKKRIELVVTYEFTDADGTVREEHDTVSEKSWDKLEEGTVTVQYLPGVANSSRLKGHTHTWSLFALVACVGGLGYFGFKLVSESRQSATSSSPPPAPPAAT